MSIHQVETRPMLDATAHNPATLARQLSAALADLAVARADVRRLTRGRRINDARAAQRVARALAQLHQAEAEADRLARAVETAGGQVRPATRGQVVVIDRRGRTIATPAARKAGHRAA